MEENTGHNPRDREPKEGYKRFILEVEKHPSKIVAKGHAAKSAHEGKRMSPCDMACCSNYGANCK